MLDFALMWLFFHNNPDNKVHGANMGPTWVLSAPDGPHVGPINLAIREWIYVICLILFLGVSSLTPGQSYSHFSRTFQRRHMRVMASEITSDSNICSTACLGIKYYYYYHHHHHLHSNFTEICSLYRIHRITQCCFRTGTWCRRDNKTLCKPKMTEFTEAYMHSSIS